MTKEYEDKGHNSRLEKQSGVVDDQRRIKQHEDSIFLSNKKRIIVVQKPELDNLTSAFNDESPGIFPVSKENLLRRIESSEQL